jgi:hypothetical protein
MPDRRRPSATLIAIAVTNLVFAAFVLAMGVLPNVVDINWALGLIFGVSADSLPSIPEEVSFYYRVTGAEAIVESLLLWAGGIGLLLVAHWGRVACLIYAGLTLVAHVLSTAADVLLIQPVAEPWLVELSEAVASARHAVEPPEVSALTGVATGLCCASPYIAYSLVLFAVLTRPAVKDEFGRARAGADGMEKN